jgi:hypothetical protein
VPSVVITGWQWDKATSPSWPATASPAASSSRLLTRTRSSAETGGAGPATHQMIGPDYGMRMWTICIAAVFGHMGLWRAITGWSADPEDIDWYGKW